MPRHAQLLLRLSILSLMLAPPLALGVRHPVAEGKTWAGLMLALPALWGGLLLALVRGDAWARARSALLPLLAVHAAIGLSMLAATDLPMALARWAELAAWSALVPLAAMLGIERRWPARLVGVITLTVALVAAQALASVSAVAGLAQIEAGTLGNRNQLGQLLALGGFPLLAWILMRRDGLARLAALALGMLFLAALLITRSKGAWISLPIAVSLALSFAWLLRLPRPAIPRSQRRWAAAATLTLLVVGGGLTLTLALRHPEHVTREWETLDLRSRSIGVRLGLWARSIDILRGGPILGCGIGQWPLAVAPMIDAEHLRLEPTRPREAHCDWLQWAAETGAVGIAALLGLLLWTARVVPRALRDPSPALWAGVMTLLTLSTLLLIDFPIQRAVPAIIGAVWLGTLAGAGAPGAPPPRRLALLPALALAVLTLAAVPGLCRFHVRSHHLGVAQEALTRGPAAGDSGDVARSVERCWALGASPLWADTLAVAALRAERPDLARQILTQACRRDPGWFEHWRLLAQVLGELGERNAALAAAVRAVDLAPEWASALWTLERLAWAAGDRDLALAALDRLGSLDAATRAQALRERALLLQEMRRFEEAAAAAGASLAIDPSDALVWQVLGTALEKLGQLEMARDALREAVARDATLVDAWHVLATVHVRRWEGEEAERSVRRALEFDDRDPLLWDVLAYALALQWRMEEAHVAVDRALELDPECASAWRTRGLIHNQEGDLRAGAEALVHSWRLNPEDPLTRELLVNMGVQLPDMTEE